MDSLNVWHEQPVPCGRSGRHCLLDLISSGSLALIKGSSREPDAKLLHPELEGRALHSKARRGSVRTCDDSIRFFQSTQNLCNQMEPLDAVHSRTSEIDLSPLLETGSIPQCGRVPRTGKQGLRCERPRVSHSVLAYRDPTVIRFAGASLGFTKLCKRTSSLAVRPFSGTLPADFWQPASFPLDQCTTFLAFSRSVLLARPVPYTLATICYASPFTKMARYPGSNSQASSRGRGSPKQKRPGVLLYTQTK